MFKSERLDHGALSIPNRTKNINKELDKYKEQKAKADRRKLDDIRFINEQKLKEQAEQLKPVKEQAWDLYKKHSRAMIKKHGNWLSFRFGNGLNNNLNARDFLKETAKHEPRRFLQILDWHLEGGSFD